MFEIVHADTFYNYDDEYKTFEITISLLQNSFLYREKETIETERERHKNTNLISIPYHRWLIIFLYKRLKFLFKSKTRYELNR